MGNDPARENGKGDRNIDNWALILNRSRQKGKRQSNKKVIGKGSLDG